jgi:hypothetical protein
VEPSQLKEQFITDILKDRPVPSLIFCNEKLIDGGIVRATLWLFQHNKLFV